MSFDIQDKSKFSKEVLQYNYGPTPVGIQEKKLETHGYLKYEFSHSISSGFSHPNVVFGENKYVCEKLYIFNHFYNIQNINYDGMLVIENKPITQGLLSSSNLFTVFLLKTESNLFLSNDLDKLFDGNKSSVNLDMNPLIAKNQSCIAFKNVILFTSPISVASKFNDFVTPKNVSMGLLNSFSPDYTIVKSSKMSKTTTIENFKNSLADTEFTDDVECNASDSQGADISQIALVPVDSDYLNGVYQITMMRTLFDVFIFIFILIFCIFVSPPVYKYLVLDYVRKFTTNPTQQAQVLSFLDVLFSILLIMLGVILAIDGTNTANGTEMVIGIYFTIVVFFSICAIRYNKPGWGLTNPIFQLPTFSLLFQFIVDLFRDRKFGKIFLSILVFLLFVLLMAWLIQFSILKNNSTKVSWTLFLFMVIPISTIVFSFITVSLYSKRQV